MAQVEMEWRGVEPHTGIFFELNKMSDEDVAVIDSAKNSEHAYSMMNSHARWGYVLAKAGIDTDKRSFTVAVINRHQFDQLWNATKRQRAVAQRLYRYSKGQV